MSNKEKTLEERLNEHPELKAFVDSSLELIDSTQITAHEAEEILVERIREYSSGILEEWAKKKK